MPKPITYEEYKIALKEKERLEKYVEHLTKITRGYMYQEEAQRVVGRKEQSAKENNRIL